MPGSASSVAARNLGRVTSIGWVDLDGVVNMRDVGGLPTVDGRTIRTGRLLRSDNLQDLTEADVEHLLGVRGVTDIVDLRSTMERESEGPSPLQACETVVHHHLTLLPEQERLVTADDALVLPWRGVEDLSELHDDYWTAHYLSYLADRPDSTLTALRVIAGAAGATIVHCAVGKDRTGTIVGLALAVAGVPPQEIVADYVATAERLQRIVDRLIERPAYRDNLRGRTLEEQLPRAESMELLLDALERRYGGPLGFLARHGWTDQETVALRAKLRD